MAEYKCKRYKQTKTKVCADFVGRGKNKRCVRKKTVTAKRCADYGVKGKVKGGVYAGGKVRKRARRAR